MKARWERDVDEWRRVDTVDVGRELVGVGRIGERYG